MEKDKGMTVTSTFPKMVFSSSIPSVTVATDETRVHVTITVGADEIYNEYLFPDSGGKVEVSEMSDLVSVHVRRKLVADLNVTLQEERVTVDGDKETVLETDNRLITTRVVYCAALVEQDAYDFCLKNFLTLLQGAKITSMGRLEYLHYLHDEIDTDEPGVDAYYTDGTQQSFTPEKVGGNDDYSTIDVSPANFAVEGKTLHKFRVHTGWKEFFFVLDFLNPDVAPVLLFTNSFGCQEIAYCLGTHTVSPEFKFSAAYIGQNKRNYDVEEVRTFKADTGVLTYPMAFWMNDLFRSDEVQLLNFYDGEPHPGKMAVITDVKAEYDNNHDTLPRFTFSYEYAQRNHNVLDVERAGRIFDNTFDHTFN